MQKAAIFKSTECTICFEETTNMVLYMPCGHMCVCAECDGRIGDKCPSCRESVSQRLVNKKHAPASVIVRDTPILFANSYTKLCLQIGSNWEDLARVSGQFSNNEWRRLDWTYGHSTTQMARAVVRKITNNFTDPEWHDKLDSQLREARLDNVANWLAKELTKFQ